MAAAAACASGPTTSSRSNEPLRALMSADVMMLVSFDSDGDLSIGAAEVDAGLDREFARADSNGDGSMQPIEFQNWGNLVLGGGHLGPYRLDFDRNVDNVITREEFDTEIRARVTYYDEDENDVLARSEFVRLIGQTRPPRERPAPAPPPRR
ncbi:MAG: hypothetical protein ACREH4_00935 [Vitreimonas sp.]